MEANSLTRHDRITNRGSRDAASVAFARPFRHLAGSFGSSPPVIVCVCNALSESRCREAACRPDCKTVGCLYRLQGARVRCGRCLPHMQALLEEVRAAAAAGAGAPAVRTEGPVRA